MAKFRCPYCEAVENKCVPWVAYRNVENYGSSRFNVKCKSCKNMVHVYIERRAILTYITKSDTKNADFDNFQMED
jgi:transcriptional regulator NrdR family protein